MKADDPADAATPDDAPQTRLARIRLRQFDVVSFTAGLLFIAIGLLAVADLIWADIDPMLILGGSAAVIGVAVIVRVAIRQRHRRHERQAQTTTPRKEQG
ncbi:MAG: hypothetical protein OXG57_12380 [Acidimicrobiaceae bacterium]|nr:hypothetical protein [Acidimicrobiaceae bacterium]MCY3892179.1 hypothetical protein [Acidimicrobiaceae bacterium]